jgi:hypothetical protein
VKNGNILILDDLLILGAAFQVSKEDLEKYI